MTKLDRVSRMPARTLLYGFLGFIAVASAVTMFSDPLDPEVGNGSANPGDWSEGKLKLYLSDNQVPFSGEDRRSVLIKLVKQHISLQERSRQDGDNDTSSERDPLLGTAKSKAKSSAQTANERLESASNLR